MYAGLQNALDRMRRVPECRRQNGWLTLVHARLMAFGMVLAIGFLPIVSLVASAMLPVMGRRLGPIFGAWQVVVDVGNALGAFVLVAFMLGLIHRVMSRQRIRVSDIWPGALIAALRFTGGRTLIGMSISRSGVASDFGAAGSLVVVLSWVYFSSQIPLASAEFICVYARTCGSRRPSQRVDAALESDRSDAGAVRARRARWRED